jgi:hypothetical protein
MRKAEVLRLKAGQYVCWGDRSRASAGPGPSPWGQTYEGEVMFVTGNGGVRVREHESGQERWIGYHHVIHTDGTVWWHDEEKR